MSLFEVVLQQSFAGQKCINRFNYIASGTPAGATFSAALVQALGGAYDTSALEYPSDKLMRKIAAMQTTDVIFTSLVVKDVYDPVDFFETPFVPTLNGDLAPPSASPAVSLGFRTSRTRTDIRRGFKRFVGVATPFVGSGGVVSTGPLWALMGDVASEMTKTITFDDEGNTLSFQPVIVSKEKCPCPVRGIEAEAYYYYDTFAEQQQHMSIGFTWQRYTEVRTQRSRQYGEGA